MRQCLFERGGLIDDVQLMHKMPYIYLVLVLILLELMFQPMSGKEHDPHLSHNPTQVDSYTVMLI
jgi:hypothetical protein